MYVLPHDDDRTNGSSVAWVAALLFISMEESLCCGRRANKNLTTWRTAADTHNNIMYVYVTYSVLIDIV